MPKIQLKPNSPDYLDPKKVEYNKPCDMPGCPGEGSFRAPRDRSLSNHYWFCQMHIGEYNQAWDFFQGMNQKEVENHILSSMFGDRPTWRYDMEGMAEDKLRRQAWEFHGIGGADDKASKAWQEYQENRNTVNKDSAEFEAMAIFGLEPPTDLEEIKARYKELAKKLHPDINKSNPNAEEQLKKVNIAYTVLKLAYQRYDNLEKV